MALIFNSWKFYFFLLLTMSPFVSPLSFNLSNIGPDDDNRISVEGDAYITKEGIEVNTEEGRAGRATYNEHLHLWDNSSGNLTDFNTHFSFVILSFDSVYADGLAFFLAPANSSIPENSWGSGLGLAFRNNVSVKPAYPFVAVEFDTYTNYWDPKGLHVGIDISSLISATYVTWSNNLTEGKINDAWISYNSTSKNLRVIFTNYTGHKIQNASLEFTVDLRHYLPEWVSVGFSAATGRYTEKHNVKSWDFSSSLELKTENQVPNTTTPSVPPASIPTPSIPPVPNTTVGIARKKMKVGEVIGLVVGLSVFILGLISLGYYLWRKRSRQRKKDGSSLDTIMENEFVKGCGPKKFSYEELVRATDNFAEEHKLGEGGFGGVYRGFYKDLNSYVAVKRVSRSSNQGIKEYASEVKIISRLRHRNLVQLIGWCHEKRELLLVYEFLPNGSLDSHLFKENSSLTWETRYKVAQGLASALLYLHEEWEQCVIHRDIKSSNIMLDSIFNAKLGDFGLARLIDHEKDSQTTTVLAGTVGYMAPECVITGKASKESDVYSFGIVALEIACGRKPIDGRAQRNQVTMVEWVWELYGRGLHLEAVDPKLCGDYDEQEMERLMVVGLWCAHPDNTLRPSIRQAIHFLNFEAQLPLLPLQLPVSTYSAPRPNTPTSLLSQSSGTDISDSNLQPRSSSNIYNPISSTSNITSSSAASSSPSASHLYTI